MARMDHHYPSSEPSLSSWPRPGFFSPASTRSSDDWVFAVREVNYTTRLLPFVVCLSRVCWLKIDISSVGLWWSSRVFNQFGSPCQLQWFGFPRWPRGFLSDLLFFTSHELFSSRCFHWPGGTFLARIFLLVVPYSEVFASLRILADSEFLIPWEDLFYHEVLAGHNIFTSLEVLCLEVLVESKVLLVQRSSLALRFLFRSPRWSEDNCLEVLAGPKVLPV